MRFFAAILCLAVMPAQGADREKPAEKRGQTVQRNERTAQSPIGKSKDHGNDITLTGVLIDSGCPDRSNLNLTRRPSGPEGAAIPVRNQADRNITAEGERSGAIAHQTPDALSRQEDRTCAITGGTRGYGLLLDDGRLINLDEGGNTFANEAVQSSKAGQAMLNGAGPGLKPRVEVTGRLREERFFVRRLQLK
jgi:hypothetical protein